jgi:hypothetical protein
MAENNKTPISLYDLVKMEIDEKYDDLIVTHRDEPTSSPQIRIDLCNEVNLTTLISIYPLSKTIYWLATDRTKYWYSKSFDPIDMKYWDILHDLIATARANRKIRLNTKLVEGDFVY